MSWKSNWTAEISIYLQKIFAAAAPTLTKFQVESDSWRGDESYSINSAVVTILNTIDFINLKTLEFRFDEVEHHDPWWRDLWRTKASTYYTNMGRLESLHITQITSNCQLEILRRVEKWIGSIPLKKMQLFGFWYCGEEMRGLYTSTLLAPATLRELDLAQCGMIDSFSSMLSQLTSLRSLSLDRCVLQPDVDRWKHIFAVCRSLPLSYLKFQGCSYLNNENALDDYPNPSLCSPFKEERELLIPFLEHFDAVKVLDRWSDEDVYFSLSPCSCDYGQQDL